MRVSIKIKLVIAFLISNALLAALMFAIVSWRFDRGFVDYVTQVEMQRVQPVVEELANNFARTGSWQPLANDLGAWRQLIQSELETFRPPPGRRANGPGQPPGPGLRPNQGGPQAGPGRPRPPAPPSGGMFRHELLLADAERQIVIGPPQTPPSDTAWIPIDLNGATVGFLGLVPTEFLQGSLDQVFVDEQINAFAWIAALSLVISFIIGLALALLGLRPIKRLHEGMRKLAAGDYGQRLHIASKDELMDLGQQFNQLARILEENKAAQSQWLADISHELRTPVAVLRGEIEAVADGVRPLNQDRVRSLHEEVLQLQSLISELHELSLSDLGGLRYEKAELNVGEFFRRQLSLFESMADDAGLTIHFEPPQENPTIVADEVRLRQLLVNLFQNTLNYTDKPGELEVKWHVEGQELVMVWADSAPSVSDEEKQRLFDRLYRAESSRNRSTGGSGLGLAIVKNIVAAHSGRISVSDSRLGGLAFEIRLPLD